MFAKGQDITPELPTLGDAEALIIRSVTKVTMPLLSATPGLRYICTATIGLDHIDEKAIAHLNAAGARDIRVIHAPGVTAEAVADYVWKNIFDLASHRGQPVDALTLGIVGYGNCGKAVARRAEMLRMKVVLCDPPLQCRDRSFISASYKEVYGCHIVTVHVPLTGPDESDYPPFT